MISKHLSQFYINGEWVAPLGGSKMGVENPANEEIIAEVALGSVADADRAIAAARAAFLGYTVTPVAERIALLKRVLEIYNKREDDFVEAMSLEMGAPLAWAREAQFWAGQVHIESTIKAAETFHWEEMRGETRMVREGIGVCALITPWNWPMNQIACKVAPALVAGCTMILKPSEIAPLSGALFAEVMHEAGVPKGVFNLVNGTGAEVGARISSHPEVDMVSFTGSTRAGILVAQAAAPTVKRVAQELGGKSPNIILPSADFAAAVAGGVEGCFGNSGQSCDAPTRMFVPRARHDEALAIAKAKAEEFVTGDPRDEATTLGPGGERGALREDPGAYQEGHRRGGDAGDGGPWPAGGAEPGAFRQAHDLWQCDQRHDHRARGNLRPGAVDPVL